MNGMEQEEAVKWKAPQDTQSAHRLDEVFCLVDGVITPLLQMAWRLTKTAYSGDIYEDGLCQNTVYTRGVG